MEWRKLDEEASRALHQEHSQPTSPIRSRARELHEASGVSDGSLSSFFATLVEMHSRQIGELPHRSRPISPEAKFAPGSLWVTKAPKSAWQEGAWVPRLAPGAAGNGKVSVVTSR